MINIVKAETEKDIHMIADLAEIIWHEHFTPIIGKQQVEYMLEKFQSYEAISDAVKNDGYVYYMAMSDNGQLAGYLGAHGEEDCVFLSKIYVNKDFRRQGIAKKMIGRVTEDFCDKKYMYLTVNKNNEIAIGTYNSLGFEKICEQVADIGNGFVMDDFVFRKDI